MSRLVVEADGGSRGNPGPAGYGALVRGAGGDLLAEVAEGIGKATNNVAEYRGLIAGLTAAAEIDPDAAVEVRMDSKLVVEQMSGRWKVKHPDMRPLARRAAELAGTFADISYNWIPRSRNSHADRLANEAMDAAQRGERWVRREGPGSADAVGEVGGAGESGATRTRTDEAGRDSGVRVTGGASSAAPRAHGWMAPTTAPTTTIVLRHGETPLSGERRFSGLDKAGAPAELTATGVEQARRAAALMRDRGDIEAIVSSPLSRARRTAEIVGAELGLGVAFEDGLRETDFGAWEGLTFAEARERFPDELSAWLADPAVAPPGGESFADVGARVATARDKLESEHPQVTVLVVAHVTPIKMLVRDALLAPPEAVCRMALDVGCVCEIDWYADGPAVVRSLNDTGHLEG